MKKRNDMKKYKVHVEMTYWDSVEVEAETQEEAETKAFESFDIIKSAKFVSGEITYIGEKKDD
jgi:hypothetical protein